LPGECWTLIGHEDGDRDDIPDLYILEIIKRRQHLVFLSAQQIERVIFGEEMKARTWSRDK
jgi:hypothetical protein